MVDRQSGRVRVLLPEYALVIVVLVVLAALLAPALRAVTAPAAHQAQLALRQRLAQVQARARHERMPYTMAFSPSTGRFWVVRWPEKGGKAVSEDVPALQGQLPGACVVAGTTLPGDTVTFSDRGFPLARGTIYLRASDGSRDTLVVGGQ